MLENKELGILFMAVGVAGMSGFTAFIVFLVGVYFVWSGDKIDRED